MSTVPRKIRAIRAIKVLLTAINGSGAYFNTVNPDYIVAGRVSFDETERPAIGINEEQSDYEDKRLARTSELTMTVKLDAFAVSNTVSPGETAMFLEADIKRALAPGGVRKLSDADGDIGSFTIGPFESISSGRTTDIEGYSITLDININEKLGDPAA